LPATLGSLWDELRGLFQDHLLLASLESQRILPSLVRTLILAGVCIALLVGAWASAVAGLTVWLVEDGWSIAGTLALVVGGTLVLAAGLFWLARRSLRSITFPATLRRLTNAPLPRRGSDLTHAFTGCPHR